MVDEAEGRESLDQAEEGFRRMPGSQQATEETYVDLHEHCVALGRLARWDPAGLLLGAGTLFLGAGGGAWAAGSAFTSRGVLLAGGVGLALLVGGFFLRDGRVRSIRDLHQSFERRLSLYDDDPRAQAIKLRFEEMDAQAKERSGWSRLTRLLKKRGS